MHMVMMATSGRSLEGTPIVGAVLKNDLNPMSLLCTCKGFRGARLA
jgi:hypothetical protein